jgi:DNA-binding NtrC family response regulator
VNHMINDPNQRRILIVDDDANIITTLRKFLWEHGYEAYGCSSGKEALEVLQGTRFDVLLVDLIMPEMDGLELLRASLKQDPFLMGIMITGHGTIESAVDAMRMGAFHYIVKPFNFNELLFTISHALELRHLRESEKKHHILTKKLTMKVQELENFRDKATRLEYQMLEMKEELEELKNKLSNKESLEKQSFYYQDI